MKGFRRGERGFTLVELLIVVAILGVLAAVVIPNVVGLLGRGGNQAYETDSSTIQLAASTFYSDVHGGFVATGLWGCNGTAEPEGHFYPDSLGYATAHVLDLGAYEDPDIPNNFIIWDTLDGSPAQLDDISAHAIWMGLLVQSNEDYETLLGGNTTTGTDDRWNVSTLPGEDDLYLQEFPQSALVGNTRNGDPGFTDGGSYCWIVANNGSVYGAYFLSDVTPVGLPQGDYWFAGFSGGYP